MIKKKKVVLELQVSLIVIGKIINHFLKKTSFFRINAGFEADYEVDNSRIENKTTKIYEQNPVCSGY